MLPDRYPFHAGDWREGRGVSAAPGAVSCCGHAAMLLSPWLDPSVPNLRCFQAIVGQVDLSDNG